MKGLRLPDPAEDGKYCVVTTGRLIKAIGFHVRISGGLDVMAKRKWADMTHCERVIYRHYFNREDAWNP